MENKITIYLNSGNFEQGFNSMFLIERLERSWLDNTKIYKCIVGLFNSILMGVMFGVIASAMIFFSNGRLKDITWAQTTIITQIVMQFLLPFLSDEKNEKFFWKINPNLEVIKFS
ncbi:hypothetical protein [Dapis sp. BLCC M229]|uniref:hypothetical protein n=1 Tax=Dapis sp. BLCC M229 TaxID=3400188 RepID=UPI003CEDE225